MIPREATTRTKKLIIFPLQNSNFIEWFYNPTTPAYSYKIMAHDPAHMTGIMTAEAILAVINVGRTRENSRCLAFAAFPTVLHHIVER